MKWGILLAALTGVLLIMQLLLVTVALGAAFNAASTSGSDSCDTSGSSSGGSVTLSNAKVYAAGDSIMAGLADPSLSYGAPLRKKMEKKAKGFSATWHPGKDLEFGIEHAEPQKIQDADIVIMEYGTNGAFHGDFKGDLDRMIKLIRKENKQGDQVPIYWVQIFSGGENVNQWRDKFNEILAQEDRITVIPTKKLGYGTAGGDKIHPDTDGYADLAEDIIAGVADSSSDSTGGADSAGVGGENCDDADSTGGTVSGDVQSLAKQLLDSGNAAFPLDAQSANGSTAEVVKAMAKGEKPYTTCPGGAKQDEVEVSTGLMKFLVELTKDTKVGINAITDKCHSSGSNHYKGIAVDFECKGIPFNTQKADRIAQKYGGARNGETCAAHSHWHYDFKK